MKKLSLLAFFVSTLLAAAAAAKDAPSYPSSAAKAHLGEQATVVGPVSGVHVTGKGDTLINLGAAYPDHDFTAVVFADDTAKFSGLDELEGKTVAVTGTIKLYHGKPEIVVKEPGQLRIPKS
jgi:DNA/RNA endonuclease YhcR with UshA esterase domain